MEIHVLNGDALAKNFPVSGEVIVCREAMIEGPADANDEETLWQQRSQFIIGQYKSSRKEYDRFVVDEYDKLKGIPYRIVNLWFEHDLFCQANLWFTIAFISRHRPKAELYIAMPDPNNDPLWSGFGKMSASDLQACYRNRVYVNAEDKQLAIKLWGAYRKNDRLTLERLSHTESSGFPKLREVCFAHLDRNRDSGLGRPQQKLRSIIKTGETDFEKIFNAFQITERIYGFGDLQVKKLLNEVTR